VANEGHTAHAVIRYAQCWEDADVLLAALDVRRDDVCLSIASGGDNTLSLLAGGPARVIAVDVSPAQLACLELRVAAYRSLSHAELLELMGARPSAQRVALYERLRPALSPGARTLWDARRPAIAQGIGGAGRFERYMELFRRYLLPLVHDGARLRALFQPRTAHARRRFYAREWNKWSWRLLVRLYCSRFVSSRLGRDPAFFRYVDGPVAQPVLDRLQRVLCDLEPANSPYLYWMLFGRYDEALPHALRAENFELIRGNLHKLEWHCTSLETFLAAQRERSIMRFNLSDVFEYMSAAHAESTYAELARVGSTGARLAYWNTFVPRRRPDALAGHIRPRDDVAGPLRAADKLFFYDTFVVEEVAPA
jgi:S-adenosylmethionine-diacylglycerol 3-amino-3-carboxypropyl transferase